MFAGTDIRIPLASRRRWALALVFLALGGLACLWPASQDARGASSPTLRYVTETLDPFPPGTSSLSALCPKRTDVIGGGVGGGSFGVDPGETDIEVRATGPERLPDDPDPTTDDGWFGAVSNKDDPSAVLFVDAICARGASLDYRDRFKSVPADSQATRRVRCPQGTNVTGGGVVDNVGVLADSDFPMEVAASAPFDGNDGDSRPDDGWFVRVTNGESETRNVIARAVCARRGSYRYVKDDKAVPRATNQFKRVRCPQGTRVVGGGADTTAADPEFEIAQTAPFDGDDQDPRPDDGWTARVNNDSPDPPDDPGRDTKMRVFAVCSA